MTARTRTKTPARTLSPTEIGFLLLHFGLVPRAADVAVITRMGATPCTLAEYAWDHLMGEPKSPSLRAMIKAVNLVLAAVDGAAPNRMVLLRFTPEANKVDADGQSIAVSFDERDHGDPDVAVLRLDPENAHALVQELTSAITELEG